MSIKPIGLCLGSLQFKLPGAQQSPWGCSHYGAEAINPIMGWGLQFVCCIAERRVCGAKDWLWVGIAFPAPVQHCSGARLGSQCYFFLFFLLSLLPEGRAN